MPEFEPADSAKSAVRKEVQPAAAALDGPVLGTVEPVRTAAKHLGELVGRTSQ